MKAAKLLRSRLSVKSLLLCARDQFRSVTDLRHANKISISLVDALMSGLAIFSLKFPSLLKFDEQRQEKHIRHHLRTLFGVQEAPCDTQRREILDPVEPTELHSAYRAIFQKAQESGALEPFRFLDKYYLVSIDGTGLFSSSKIACSECAIKKKRNGETLHYHQLLAAAIMHPDQKAVLPLIPEPIVRRDGNSKNDCEQTAVKRLLDRLVGDYPDLRFVVVEDSLFSKGTHLKLLKKLKLPYIIGVKEGDHEHLFKAVREHEENETMEGRIEYDKTKKITRFYRFLSGLELNKSHPDLKVNFIEYIELKGHQVQCRFTWITDIKITESNCAEIVRGGRARWKIENETFNTLKNQGYRLEHNFGHGKQHLSTNFALLTILAFFIDQLQELGCPLFQKARRRFRSRTSLWERLRALFVGYLIDEWDSIWQSIVHGHQVSLLKPITVESVNTS